MNNPRVHAAAVKRPEMLGGPFVDFPEPRVDEIQALLRRTRAQRTEQLQFAEAVGALDELLRVEAKGASLAPLYAKVPEPVRGRLELVYDRNGHADFRLFEALLYQSSLYATSAQSVALSRSGAGERRCV